MAINVDKIAPDFKEKFNKEGKWHSAKIFDFATWRKEENYKSIVLPEEDIDSFGNKGLYDMNEDFSIVVLMTYTGEEHIQQVLDAIPGSEKFGIVKLL